MKKIYDLSHQAMAADEQRIIKADSGKEYNVSFRPAILNRKYYKRWSECQKDIIARLYEFTQLQNKVITGVTLSQKEADSVEEFTKLSEDAAEAGTELIVFAMRANGYEDFSEDELYMNFSAEGIAKAINFIMGMEDVEEVKKNIPTRKVSF